jgi:hypothetical protein
LAHAAPSILCRVTLLFLTATLSSCVFHRVEVSPVEPTDKPPLIVESPVKAHLIDGSTVVFPDGVTVLEKEIRGDGQKYDLTLQSSVRVSSIPLEDIAAMESYQTPIREAETVAGSAVAGSGVFIGGVLLFKALFGSCPTTYSLHDGEFVLEAESFSYSIAPSFETRDVDRLGVQPVDDEVRLELRNEALETHYINQLELVEITHQPDQLVFPDPNGRPIVVSEIFSPAVAVDNSRREVTRELSRADGDAWESPDHRLQTVSTDDFRDHLDLEFDVPTNVRETALVLRVRNSLLNTVLLYDVMLQGQGWRALDWMGQDLDGLVAKLRLGYWYRDRMGMSVSVWRDGAYREIEHLPDTGPIAWQDVALTVPVTEPGRLRVRLSFVADNWRIDRVGIAKPLKNGALRTVALTDVLARDGSIVPEASELLRSTDDDYLITRPGEQLTLRFHVGDSELGAKRTYFLAAEGYYIEWMRREWLQTVSPVPFRPSDDALIDALLAWADQRDAYRAKFEATKIPVR